MTAIHPVMGIINALAPNLGDPTAYTQGPLAGVATVLCAACLVWTIVIRDDWHKGSGGLLVVSFLTSVAIGMALELGQLLLNHVCCKCCPCHDDDAILDAPAGQRADDAVVAQPAA